MRIMTFVLKESNNSLNSKNKLKSYFQLNDNQISDWASIDALKENKSLATIYLERNPVARDIQYRKKLKLALPHLQKIDATLCR